MISKVLMGFCMGDKKKILMVDDVALNHATARDVLGDTYELYEATSGKEAFELLKEISPDLILLDVIMPEMDGMEVLKRLKSLPAYREIPVIFLTADTSPESEVEGFQLGIVDYITKPFVPMVMKKRIETQIDLSEYQKKLEERVNRKVAEMERMYDIITVSFAGLVESRDGVTGVHLKNTSIYFSAFINHLKTVKKYKEYLPENVVKKACRCAPLHDVGKIAIKDSVLQKPASLSEEEYEDMKLHSAIGGELFDYLETQIPDSQFARIASQLAKSHHERWDGKGYPNGLKGEEIPFLARVMAIVDVYDAMTSARPYKEPVSHEKTMAFIAANSGVRFDPELVNEFLNISNEIKECLETKEMQIAQKHYFSVKYYD
ncbi:MAG: response regulator [Lachnospiraceae bacterium]|nr:response regulator [Lachnospiraceae bacterium]